MKINNIFKTISYDIIQFTVNFESFLNRFIKDVKFRGKIYIITQLKSVDGNYFTIGSRTALDTTNNLDINNYLNSLKSKYDLLDQWYKNIHVIKISFNYTQISDQDYERLTNLSNIKNLTTISKEDQFLNINTLYNLPLNTDYVTWGKVIQTNYTHEGIFYKIELPDGKILEVFKLKTNSNRLLVYTNNSLFFTIIDKPLSNELFIRNVGDKLYYIHNNQVIFHFNPKFNIKNISKLSKNKESNLSIITLDVETYTDSEDIMQLYCVGLYDGNNKISFHILDYDSLDSMINDLLKTLLNKNYSNRTIYIHNSSNFDLVFLLKYLVNYEGVSVDPIIRDGKFINISVNFGLDLKHNIKLRDSLLLLPAKLKDLAIQFGVEQQKLDFDHNLINQSNLLEFKDKAIKYCIADCVALYQVLLKFNREFFDMFKVNISAAPTLPSLSLRLFRTGFMNVKIPILSGNVFNDLSKAYYGGHTDMYIPYIDRKEDATLYIYDINGLYPHVMKEYKFPTQLIGYFIGNISNMYEYKHFLNNLGIYKVRITAPSIENPLLPHKMDNTTVYGEGKWTGWYFSEELRNAENYGYKYDILAGYIFESEYLFSNYIDTLYQIKAKSPKDSPKYLISKLSMNSLAGRLGMNPNNLTHKILDSKELSNFISKIGLENLETEIKLNNKSLVSYMEDFPKSPKINMAIALAITAYGRIYMSQFLNGNYGKVYYIDTDCVILDRPLPDYLVDPKKLGFMKLVDTLNDFVAIGPKAYGGMNEEGMEFTKVKGLKNKISLDLLSTLLFKDNDLPLYQDKWHKSFSSSNILVKETSYNLKPNNNKRELVYKENLLISTKSKLINE